MKTKRNYSGETLQFVALLGMRIRVARKIKKLSENEFASSVGISRSTLQKIEKGNLQCEIGVMIEAAVLLEIKLVELKQ